MDKILMIPVPNEKDPEVNQIIKELNEEIALLAKGPMSPIRSRSVPKINNRYHRKRGDWQLMELNTAEPPAEKPKPKKKIRIRPLTSYSTNAPMSVTVNSKCNNTPKPRVVSIEQIPGTLMKKVICHNPRNAPETSTSTNTITSTPSSSTATITKPIRQIPIITIDDELPPGVISPPKIPKPVMQANVNMARPQSTSRATNNKNVVPVVQVGKKKRKRHIRNERHGLRYVREGEILYKVTKRKGGFERKVVKNPIWRGQGPAPPNN
ncbi:hypothetical protein PV326_008848 [Microctonus aethiopoides]|nr:hypothetical protein PV326_008848 [Microctonus aethiopoides]